MYPAIFSRILHVASKKLYLATRVKKFVKTFFTTCEEKLGAEAVEPGNKATLHARAVCMFHYIAT